VAVDRFLLGIDGGQTSTKSLLAQPDGTIVAAGEGSASDHFHIEGGIERNRRALHGTIETALERGGVVPSAVYAVALGLTGAPPEGEARRPVYDVILEVLSPEHITIHPDYVTNLIGASSGGPGVVLVAGGGAIGYGIASDGREALAGGYGYLMGDEGSAFKIGLAAIRAATFHHDFRGEPTTLTQSVADYFGIDSLRDLPRVVYKAGFERNRISLLAPIVATAADEGDLVAGRILDAAGRSLGLVALGVLRQLFRSGTTVDVFLTGGVFNIGSRITEPLREVLAEDWPTAATRAPRFPPAVGAVIVAARSAGIEVDDAFLERVRRSSALLSTP
jgi:N-acetylglucosamine kinase-like BadF-type ATPase